MVRVRYPFDLQINIDAIGPDGQGRVRAPNWYKQSTRANECVAAPQIDAVALARRADFLKVNVIRALFRIGTAFSPCGGRHDADHRFQTLDPWTVQRSGAWWLPALGALLLGACTGYVLPPLGSAPSGGAGAVGPAGGTGGTGGNGAACTSVDPGG